MQNHPRLHRGGKRLFSPAAHTLRYHYQPASPRPSVPTALPTTPAPRSGFARRRRCVENSFSSRGAARAEGPCAPGAWGGQRPLPLAWLKTAFQPPQKYKPNRAFVHMPPAQAAIKTVKTGGFGALPAPPPGWWLGAEPAPCRPCCARRCSRTQTLRALACRSGRALGCKRAVGAAAQQGLGPGRCRLPAAAGSQTADPMLGWPSGAGQKAGRLLGRRHPPSAHHAISLEQNPK